MRQHQLVRLVGHRHIAIGRLAQKAAHRHRAQLVVDRHHAPVQRRGVAQVFRCVFQHRVGRELPRKRRGHHLALRAHLVAKTALVFHRHVQAVGQVVRDGAGRVQRRTAQTVAACIGFDRMRRLPQRLFAHDVEHAAGLAAAIQRSGRAFQKLNALHPRQVTRRVKAPVGRKPVEQRRHARVLVARQASDGDVVPQPAKVVLARDPAHIVQHIIQPRGAQVVQRLARHHAHRLRQLAQRQAGLGALRFVGVVGA